MSEMQKKENNPSENVCETIYLQFNGKEVPLSTIRSAIKEDYSKAKAGKDKATDIKIYLKPEDCKAYYVINEDYAGEVLIQFE